MFDTSKSRNIGWPLGVYATPTFTYRMDCEPADAPVGVSGPCPPRLLYRTSLLAKSKLMP